MKNVLVGDVISSSGSGFACSKSKLVDVGLLHLRPFNISNDGQLTLKERYFVPHSEAPINCQQLNEGDILFNNTNSVELVGKAALIRDPIVAGYSNHLTRISVDSKVILPTYFMYWLQYMKSTGYFSSQATQWVSQAAYKVSDLKLLSIPLPDLDLQNEIVQNLEAICKVISNRREILEKLEELTTSVFYEMFGDVVSNNMGWQVEKFGNIGVLDRGKSRHRPRDAGELYGGKYPFIQTGDVANSNGEIRSFKHTYSDLGLAQSKLWNVNTLCITIAANIAKTAILRIPACFPDSVVGFIADKSKTNVRFVQTWLSFLQPILEANAPQAAQKNINLQILRDLPIPLPTLELQDVFSSRIESIIALRNEQDTALAKSSEALSSLLNCFSKP
jgi:type I restriction enzyme S subunit